MTRLQNIIIYIIGIVYLLSGLGKAMNVLYFQTLIHGYGIPYLDLLAPAVILVELVIAFLYFVRWRVKTISLCSIIILLVFTMIYTFGYTRQGITECGCFGVLSIPELPPIAVYLRNTFLLILSNYLYFTTEDESTVWTRRRWIVFCCYLCCGMFCTGMTYRPIAYLPDRTHPLEGKLISELSWSEILPEKKSMMVLFYSHQCSHCMNTLENFFALQRYERMDTIIAIAVKTNAEEIPESQSFWDLYPKIGELEIEEEALQEIKEFPTSLLIVSDTIRQVFVGELPNPYLIETSNTKLN